MDGLPAEAMRTFDLLGVSLDRREAMTDAIRSGRLRELPWASPHVALDIPLGTVVDERYRLDRVIGAGGMGAVFEGHDHLSGRRVAVKVLSQVSPRVSLRMLQEIAVLRRLDLPCVVGFLDEGEVAGNPYVVMPYLQGHPFPGVDHDGTWRTLGPRVLALAEALARVHAVGVLHRDLKPDNVLWVGGAPMLLDFGLAVSEALVFAEQDDLAGTPAYLAPEQYLGSEPTERSDLFSLGVLLYEVLSGQLPFVGGTAMDMITQLLARDPEPLRERAPGIPEGVAELVHALLDKDPERRMGTAADVVRHLRALVPTPEGLPTELGGQGPANLEHCFAGPEVVHHLRSDPAVVLWRRTGGDQELVRQTLGAWVRAGVARVRDGRIAMRRDAVDRLLAGMPVDPCRGTGAEGAAVDPALHGLWGLVGVMAPWATPERLARWSSRTGR